MRYYLDTEFIDDGKTIDLISVGIVCEDGRELYLQSVEFDIDKASQWVRDNVIMHLDICPHVMVSPGPIHSLGTWYGAQAQHKKGQCTFEKPATAFTGLSGVKIAGGAYLIGTHADCPWRTREQIKREVLAFLDAEHHDYPELVGWCCAYDFVVFCQLWGTMMDVPRFIPHSMIDIQQILDERGIPDEALPIPEGQAHNALADAKHIQQIWRWLHAR